MMKATGEAFTYGQSSRLNDRNLKVNLLFGSAAPRLGALLSGSLKGREIDIEPVAAPNPK